MQMEGIGFKDAMNHLTNGGHTKYKANYEKYKADDDFWKDFDYTKYLTYDENEKKAIISYGQSRSISSGYYCGVYFTRSPDRKTWVRNPAMMFVHQDKEGNIIGAKFRNINGNTNPRFTTRGRLGFYILDTEVPTQYKQKCCWLVESETSSNSLWSYFKDVGTSCWIVSMGGVSSAPKELPSSIQGHEVRLVIDYDGNEELYQERLKQYEHLKATPVKIVLSKGEDINSLYHKKEMWKIENLLSF
jgi:hypothetical protein